MWSWLTPACRSREGARRRQVRGSSCCRVLVPAGVTQFVQEPVHRPFADRMTGSLQFRRQSRRAAAGRQQRPHRIAAGNRIDQSFQLLRHGRVACAVLRVVRRSLPWQRLLAARLEWSSATYRWRRQHARCRRHRSGALRRPPSGAASVRRTTNQGDELGRYRFR